MNKRTITLLTVTPVMALMLSACGSSSSSNAGGGGHDTSNMGPSASMMTGTHNAADVTFATDMIPHHAQAIAMAKLASTRASSPEVKALAAEIEAAQGPEIATMTGWLTRWGAPVPGDMSGHDMSMPGMMSMTDMASLEPASGAAFDTMFLTMMIAHHEGAITQAEAELSNGADPEAKKLAQAIIDGQTKEIATMKALLGA